LAIAHTVARAAPLRASARRRAKLFAYFGTYTGAAGSGSNGEGIYLFEMDRASGELKAGGLAAQSHNPSWIVIHPSCKCLYTVNEISDYQGDSGSVSAFAVSTVTGELRALNTVSSEGAGPAYLSIDQTGRFAFVATAPVLDTTGQCLQIQSTWT
jgi:6-phosphogluconolactonase (cycloisomerase 2 family)